MKNRILQYSIAVIGAALFFIAGFHCGKQNYKSELISVKHIDGKYGKAFYAVEVFGKDAGNCIEIYAKINIGGFENKYWHNCGKIGIAWNWEEAKQKFSDINFDGSVLSIGKNYSIKKEEYENHR